MDYLKRYQEWLESDEIDEETKEELRKIKNDETEIKDSFYKDLEFGTAGLRGIVGIRYKQNEQIYSWKSNTRISKFYYC